MQEFGRKFPSVKLLRIVSDVAIPNFPDRNVPTLLLYQRGNPIHQRVGPSAIPANFSALGIFNTKYNYVQFHKRRIQKED